MDQVFNTVQLLPAVVTPSFFFSAFLPTAGSTRFVRLSNPYIHFIFLLFALRCCLRPRLKMVDTMEIPIARSGRDSMIAIGILWVLYAASVGFRLWGRLRGPGLALDDIFAIVALVRMHSYQDTVMIQLNLRVAVGLDHQYYRSERCRYGITVGACRENVLLTIFLVFTTGVGWDLVPTSPVYLKRKPNLSRYPSFFGIV
jgi:hypothetical protein